MVDLEPGTMDSVRSAPYTTLLMLILIFCLGACDPRHGRYLTVAAVYTGEGMDEMEFTEAESNMNDLNTNSIKKHTTW